MEPLKRNKRFLRGILLVEAIVAVAFFAAVSSSVVFLTTSLLTETGFTKDSLKAQLKAEEGLEAARAIRDAEWSDLSAGSHGLAYVGGTWSFSGTSDTEDGFTRSVTVTDLSTNERQVNVSVSWDKLNGQSITHTLKSVLSNWRNISILSGDWDNPDTVLGDELDFGYGFRAIGIDIGENVLYVAGHGSVTSAYELCTVDVEDPENPFILGCTNVGSSGINEVAVNEDFTIAFTPRANKSGQMQIFYITPVDNPRVASTYAISGNGSKGRSIDYANGFVYLGTEGPATAEFYVIDVSDYQHPSVRSSVVVGNDVNDVHAVGDYAYIVSDVDNREVGIIDISNPDDAQLVTFVDLPGNNDAEGVFFDPTTNRAYIGRQVSTGSDTPEIVILDVSDPENPEIIAQREYDADVDSMLAIDDKMFVAADTPQEFIIYDVSNLPVLLETGSVDLGESVNPTDLLFSDNYFYIAVFDQSGIRILTGG